MPEKRRRQRAPFECNALVLAANVCRVLARALRNCRKILGIKSSAFKLPPSATPRLAVAALRDKFYVEHEIFP